MKNKPLHWYKQSSVIPYRVKNEKLQLLIITTRKKKRWIFPKGIIEENMSPEDSAVKEAYEEAGVIGELLKKQLGKYYYKKWGGECEVQVFGLRITGLLNDYEESFRERKWIAIDEVEKYIGDNNLLKIVNILHEYIKIC